MSTVSAIIAEFVNNVDTDKEYGLAEIKTILSTAYKSVKSANTPTKSSKKSSKKSENTDSDASSSEEKPKKRTKRERDADGNIIKKRLPSAYNIFVAEKIAEFKAENPDLNSKEIFKMAIDSWNKQKQDKNDDMANMEASEVAEDADEN